jgi:hypothetical protein
VLGLAPGVLNDDRIARALDALAPVLEQVTGSVGAAAISRFGIDVSQIHWDMTSVGLHGAYEHPEENYPQPKFGHPRDRRADLKQIQAGVAAADGAVPVFWQPYNGGAGGGLPGDRRDGGAAQARRAAAVPAGRRLQAAVICQHRRDDQSRGQLPGSRFQGVRARIRAGRLRL